MGGDGTPEESNKRLGRELLALRGSRTRKQVVMRIAYMLGEDHPLIDTISEGWLTRIENGRAVKVTHQEIDAICRALDCNLSQRAAIFMQGDRNPLADENGIASSEGIFLGQIIMHLRQDEDIQETIQGLLTQGKSLDDTQIKEIARKTADDLKRNLADYGEVIMK